MMSGDEAEIQTEDPNEPPYALPESIDHKNAGKTASAMETEMAQQICAGQEKHWVRRPYKLVSAISERVNRLRDECSLKAPTAANVIRLSDEVKHHVTCRAHGHDEYTACSESELGLLSEDEKEHAELIELDQVKQTVSTDSSELCRV